MLYRKLGKTDCLVSILGFGCMRFPILNGGRNVDRFDPKKVIDEEETIRMLRYAISHGVNYFDTAYPYHAGKSEMVLGKAIRGCRNQVMVATKMPVRQVKAREDFDRFLDEQLRRLDTSYVDLYLLHGLERQDWIRMRRLGALEFLDRVRADGRARYAGFSYHDDVKVFKKIVDSYDWTLCQIQYNYLDEHYQAGREGLAYAASKGLGVVVMEPLQGGRLTDRIPDEVRAIWESAKLKRTPAEWALRWVWNHPEVSTALSGMSTMDQVGENIGLADDGKPLSLSKQELSIINRVRETYKKMLKVECTGCAYCMPCKAGVNIPGNLSVYNDAFLFGDFEYNVLRYNQFMLPEQRASNCVACGECEVRCPQHIKIREELKKVHQTLSPGKNR
jgi:predicted aldo/keto reductase-like oxidoreductase